MAVLVRTATEFVISDWGDDELHVAETLSVNGDRRLTVAIEAGEHLSVEVDLDPTDAQALASWLLDWLAARA